MSGQGYRTRAGWTTSEAPDAIDKAMDDATAGGKFRAFARTREAGVDRLYIDGKLRVTVPTPNRFVRDDPPAWVWAAVMAIAAALIFLLVYLEAFK